MSQLTITNLSTLVPDMIRKGVDREHFSFIYAKQVFDCIFCFCDNDFEILVGIHTINIAFVVPVHQNAAKLYVAELKEADYLLLRRALRLSPSRDKFTSNKFLNVLSRSVHTYSEGVKISYEGMIAYRKCHPDIDDDKPYFKGWNYHLIDHDTARNFKKTELYLGKTVADYCRRNNISSIWTAFKHEKVTYRNPW